MTERHGPLDEAAVYLLGLLDNYAKVVVVGRPAIGKTGVTLKIKNLDRPLVRADDGLTSGDVAAWLASKTRSEKWLGEGVGFACALRDGAVVPDAVLWLRGTPLRPVSVRAASLGDAVDRWMFEAIGKAKGRVPWAYNVTTWKVEKVGVK